MRIKDILHTKLPGWEDGRDHRHIHASDLTKEEYTFCSRELCLMDIHKKKRKGQFINTCLRTTFDNGKDYARRLTDRYLVDHAFGNWNCIRCHAEIGPCFRPESCIACGWLDLEYSEPFFYDGFTGVQGSVDLLFQFEAQKKLKVVEIKTMDKDQFKVLAMPYSEHKLRTQLYLELIKRSTNQHESIKKKIDTEEAIVLYCSRGYGIKDDSIVGMKDHAFSPFKEFTVKADPEAVKQFFTNANLVTRYRKEPDKYGISNGICLKPGDKRACMCQMKKECFNQNGTKSEVA